MEIELYESRITSSSFMIIYEFMTTQRRYRELERFYRGLHRLTDACLKIYYQNSCIHIT